jgi:hypothetical protein
MIFLMVGILGCAMLLAGAVFGAVSAVRDEHLVVLHWSAAGTVFLEKVADGRYEARRPLELPLAVGRYLSSRVRALGEARLQVAAASPRRHVLFPAHKA